jgi:hypothetical protein
MSVLWEIVRAKYLIKVLLYQLGCGFQTGLDIGSMPVRARRQAPCGNAGVSQLGYEGSKAISLVSDFLSDFLVVGASDSSPEGLKSLIPFAARATRSLAGIIHC